MKGFILGFITAVLFVAFAALVANAATVTVEVNEDNEVVEYVSEFTEAAYDFLEEIVED